MRCPQCGAEINESMAFCGACGAQLKPSAQEGEGAGQAVPHAADAPEPSAYDTDAAALLAAAMEQADQSATAFEDEIDELFGQLSSKVADERAQAERAEEEARKAEEELQRKADEEIQRLAREAREKASEEEFRRLSRYSNAAVDATVLRPRVEEPDDFDDDDEYEAYEDDEYASEPEPADQHFVVRRTRDYDHDAQSINTVAGAQGFATITEKAPTRREIRRDPYAKSSKKGRVPGEGNSRSKLRPFLAILLIALVIGGGGAVLTYGMEMWGGKEVPSVVGESQANAELRLREKGFVTKVEAEPADDAIGKVLTQDPEAGLRIPEGDEVTIVVAANRTMPDVLGLTEEEARVVLEEAGAERIKREDYPSSKPEGTVISVTPGVGDAFVSRSQIYLTVAVPFRVPDVLGKKESTAVEEIEAAKLKADVTYVRSTKTVRTVIETDPPVGDVIEEGGTVHVKVSSPFPADPYHLAEFFDHSSVDVDTYLQKEKFEFGVGFLDSNANALATYTSKEKGNITFSSQPYTHELTLPKEGSTNILATGAPIAGVRLDITKPDWVASASAIDRKAVEELAKRCGFENLTDYCDNASVGLKAGQKITATFACASGKMEGKVWTVLLVGVGKDVRATATCAKDGLLTDADLAGFEGSLCQYDAYHEVVTAPEYQVPVKTETKSDSKKDEKKDDKKDDAKDDGNASTESNSQDDSGEQQGDNPSGEAAQTGDGGND